MFTEAGMKEEPRGHETVLVVDDDPSLLQGMADLLSAHHYRVLTAEGGLAALTIMQQEAPDLVISDIMMPGMDGYQFYEAVRSNPAWAALPFVFLTACSQPHDISLGQRLGADAYLTKPFEPQDVLAAVQARLRRAKEIRAVCEDEVNRMKQQLVTVFSHELRTPLTYIYGYVHLLQDNADLDEASRNMVAGIRRGAERLNRVVEDLMLAVRIDSGVAAVEINQLRMPVDLVPILREAIQHQQPFAEERGVRIEVEVPPQLEVECVPAYIEDAFGRVLNNAIKFSRQGGGRAVVGARCEEGMGIISVRDEGIGIAPAQQKRLFERFQQIDRQELEQQGLGLGLTLARSLVQLHGGDIEVESTPGVGSTFTIRLPQSGSGDGRLAQRQPRGWEAYRPVSGNSISIRAKD